MDVSPFGLERWFAEYEHEADIMLAESGIRSLPADRFDLDPGKLGYVIPTNGDPEFRADVGARYDRSADEVLFTVGTQEANFLTFLSLLHSEHGDHAVVVTPTYQALHAVPEAFGEVTRVPLNRGDWSVDVAGVRKAIRDDTAVVVLNNPNNPTGVYHDEETVQELYDLAAENDTYLLCDEVYRLLADEPITPAAALGEYGISTTSLTKAYGLAGLRFGWVVGDEDVVERAWRWKDYTSISPSLFGQHVAKQALGEQEDDILSENRELAREHKRIVADWINDHGLDWEVPTGVSGFVTVPDGFEDAEEFCRVVAEEASVVLAPGHLFGPYENRFRIGFGLRKEELRDGLRRVGAVIENR
ncbi:aminotransferase class I/II-fold pyridoxal phosphate-dependent enzyme [Halolamina salifodinae]|uniref:Aspartate/methionine/tyrosine aminotransferase n=1 Tax=Halolamina salifodinae TaxID=1202767 RepID=A0A8T4GVT7_9EURY|nr:aminotransferase class I/II-fold pyridoxal phosphate-dependent enzyme [Halolamina salifodinae]MBP1985804.1 aspartate/methionine/tyrosine aminotransferase [Halolamina salifodinae]